MGGYVAGRADLVDYAAERLTVPGIGGECGASLGVNGASINAQDARTVKGKEKLKDDGTCWAITAAGTRCKNHKDGEKDYCKLHAADKRVKVSPARCRALTWEGTRCTRAPEPGYNFCKQHGAPAPKAPAPKK